MDKYFKIIKSEEPKKEIDDDIELIYNKYQQISLII